MLLKTILQDSQVALVVKNPPANAGDIRDSGSIPGLGRSPGTGNGNPLPPPGDLPDPGIEPESLMSPALAGGVFTTSTTQEVQRLNRNQLENPKIRVPKLDNPEVIQSQQKSAAWALKSQEVDFLGLVTMISHPP